MKNQQETLINIVKVIGGYERHYRIEGTNKLKIVFVARPCMVKVGK